MAARRLGAQAGSQASGARLVLPLHFFKIKSLWRNCGKVHVTYCHRDADHSPNGVLSVGDYLHTNWCFFLPWCISEQGQGIPWVLEEVPGGPQQKGKWAIHSKNARLISPWISFSFSHVSLKHLFRIQNVSPATKPCGFGVCVSSGYSSCTDRKMLNANNTKSKLHCSYAGFKVVMLIMLPMQYVINSLKSGFKQKLFVVSPLEIYCYFW